MNKIKCHNCSYVQSSARDICMECNEPMLRSADYMLDEVGNPLPTKPPPPPINKPIIQPVIQPNTNQALQQSQPTATPNTLQDKKEMPEFTVICCHSCFFVQLEKNIFCDKCQVSMERTESFIFSSKKLDAKKYNELLQPSTVKDQNPEEIIAQHQAKLIDEAYIENSQPDFQKQNNINSASPTEQNNIPADNTRGLSSQVQQLQICCNKCYTVQDAKNTSCKKCSCFMSRDSVYIFNKK